MVVVSAAVIRDDGAYLITQRAEKAVLPLLWEFPGGKVEEGESHQEALARELDYRLGVKADVLEQISQVEREYDDYVVELHLYRCAIGEQEPHPHNVKDAKWVTSDAFGDYEFTPADEESTRKLLFGE